MTIRVVTVFQKEVGGLLGRIVDQKYTSANNSVNL